MIPQSADVAGCVMTSEKSSDINVINIRPFRLVKFFSFTSLVVILFTTLILSWLISNHAKKVLLDRSEAYAWVLAENLNHQVFQQFVLPTALRYGKIALRNPRQFERLDTIVRNTIHGMNIESVTIFDSKENVISYSTIKELVGKTGQGGPEYKRALKGESSSFLVSNGSLLNMMPGSEPISCHLRSYIPFTQKKQFSQDTDVVMGVIEIVLDLSVDLEAIIRLQGTILATSLLIMTLLFLVLSLIVARADRIIEARARERRRLEVKLHDSERLATLGKMVASVSHEIKNPLGIVRSTAEILGKRLRSIAPGNDHLANIIVEETSRLDATVKEFLDFARPQTVKLSMVRINDIVSKALVFMEPEFGKRNVILKNDLDQGLDPVMADQELLYRAFLNILVNGVQAMPDGGTLTVKTERSRSDKGAVTVSISDTGIGMSPETKRQIFNPFFTEKDSGTGLGLAIVKIIIDNHCGEISVESEEGKGTTFRITVGGKDTDSLTPFQVSF